VEEEMNVLLSDESIYRDWLEFFYAEANFGPAHSDVVEWMWENFKRVNDL
jgi:hypothetical protein